MARFDKYEPNVGNFRAPLAAAFSDVDDLSVAFGVGLDVNGRLVRGAGQSGITGVLILTKTKPAGAIVDVMHDGEVVEFGGDPGTVYTADTTTGVISDTAADEDNVPVGFTVEGDRLIVHVQPAPAPTA